MHQILLHIGQYWKETDKRVLLVSSVFLGLFITLNYTLHLDHYIDQQHQSIQFICWYAVFLSAFCFPYILQHLFYKTDSIKKAKAVFLLIIAPMIFAWKMSAYYFFRITGFIEQDIFWNRIIYWPSKLLVITACLFVLWKVFNQDQKFYGTGTNKFNSKPYWFMLLLMLPLIAAASTQPDFLQIYPKMQHLENQSGFEFSWWQKILFQLSYGSDFIGIELFFRGFLILAFAEWFGKNAILPMALFYCTIHFGKPLGECISSFFGGMILGIVTYHTKSIWGGLIVHLGIAWLMELGGHIGNTLSN